jgi:putative endonuclease
MGYTIIACGERDSGGELDIIAVDKRTVVFVEVKTRQDSTDASPADAVDRDKQERITRAALRYLKRHELLNQRVRFDVIAVTWPDGEQPSMRHFRGAFEATGHASMFS